MAKEQINILHGKRSEARLNHSPDVEEERNFAGDGNQFDRGFVIGSINVSNHRFSLYKTNNDRMSVCIRSYAGV